MSRTVVSLRLSAPELRFVDELAAEKNITRAAALHQIFLQQVALQEIEKSISRVIDSKLAAVQSGLDGLRQAIDKTVRVDDLSKATNYITDRIKSGGKP